METVLIQMFVLCRQLRMILGVVPVDEGHAMKNKDKLTGGAANIVSFELSFTIG